MNAKEFGAFDEEDSWDVYLVSMSSLETGKEIGKLWPVYALNYKDAIEAYRVIYKISDN